MRTVCLTRKQQGDHGTFGALETLGFGCISAELPDRDNVPNVSRIPPGIYECHLVNSPRFGRIYHVQNVRGRNHILIHSGNYAGDSQKGLKAHSHGCILLGLYLGRLGNQKAVLASRPALSDFMDHMEGEPFRLEIREDFNV